MNQQLHFLRELLRIYQALKQIDTSYATQTLSLQLLSFPQVEKPGCLKFWFVFENHNIKQKKLESGPLRTPFRARLHSEKGRRESQESEFQSTRLSLNQALFPDSSKETIFPKKIYILSL